MYFSVISIIHEIQTAFDENLNVDVKGVFLDISKAFDKVWYDGIISKLKVIVLKANYFHYSKTILKI